MPSGSATSVARASTLRGRLPAGASSTRHRPPRRSRRWTTSSPGCQPIFRAATRRHRPRRFSHRQRDLPSRGTARSWRCSTGNWRRSAIRSRTSPITAWPGAFRRAPSCGLAGVDVAALGIPTEVEYLAAYCAAHRSRGDRRAGLGVLPRVQPVPPYRHRAGHHGARVAGQCVECRGADSRARRPAACGTRVATGRAAQAFLRRRRWTLATPTR